MYLVKLMKQLNIVGHEFVVKRASRTTRNTRVCVCACACACEREKERQRENFQNKLQYKLLKHFKIYKNQVNIEVLYTMSDNFLLTYAISRNLFIVVV